jgi:hypothetical protein
MREDFEKIVMAAAQAEQSLPKRLEQDDASFWEYMSYYYGGLYVVIEGWRDQGLSDPTIDELLQSSHVNALRKYRNGSFHFQADYFNDKFLALMAVTDGPKWIQAVRKTAAGAGNSARVAHEPIIEPSRDATAVQVAD